MGISKLKMFRGVPVPWVARWSGELPDPQDVRLVPNVVVEGDKDPKNDWMWPLIEYAGRISTRDEYGILWQADGLSMTGEPNFGQVNTARQVACMKFKRCQVCGSGIKEDLLFLIPDIELPSFRASQTTTTPPVCAECAEEAPKLCPALMRGNTLVKAESMHPVAVFGELFAFHEKQVRSMGMREVPLKHVAVRAMVGKQLVMAVIK